METLGECVSSKSATEAPAVAGRINKSNDQKIAAGTLLFLGMVMIFIGLQAGVQAPIVTGIGFFVIATVYLLDKSPGA